MSLSLGLLITMGSVSVGGVLIEKILGNAGRIDDANMVGLVSKSMLITTVVGSVLSAFNEVRKLGK